MDPRGGTIKRQGIHARNDYRRRPLEREFTLGESVEDGIDKRDPIRCWDAFNEFREIESHLPRDCITAYTDGSFKDGLAGSGVVVYEKEAIIHTITEPLGRVSIAYAELCVFCMGYSSYPIGVI